MQLINNSKIILKKNIIIYYIVLCDSIWNWKRIKSMTTTQRVYDKNRPN